MKQITLLIIMLQSLTIIAQHKNPMFWAGLGMQVGTGVTRTGFSLTGNYATGEHLFSYNAISRFSLNNDTVGGVHEILQGSFTYGNVQDLHVGFYYWKAGLGFMMIHAKNQDTNVQLLNESDKLVKTYQFFVPLEAGFLFQTYNNSMLAVYGGFSLNNIHSEAYVGMRYCLGWFR